MRSRSARIGDPAPARGPGLPVSRRETTPIRLTAQVACAGCAAKLSPGDLRRALEGLPTAKRDRRVLVDHSTLDDAGVSILGGHSVKDPELKVGYAVTGVVSRRRMMTNAGVRPGDKLILTKPLGTGILSTALKRGELDPAGVRRLTRS